MSSFIGGGVTLATPVAAGVAVADMVGIGSAAVGAGTFWQAARSSATPVTKYGNDLCIRVSIRLEKRARARPVGRALFQSGPPLRWRRRTSHFGIWNSTTLSAKLRIFKLGATGPSDGRDWLTPPCNTGGLNLKVS